MYMFIYAITYAIMVIKKIGKGEDWGKGEFERETDQEGEMPIFVGFNFSPSWRGVSLKYTKTILQSLNIKIVTKYKSALP